MTNEVRHRGKDRPETDDHDAQDQSGSGKRPFDTSGMNWVAELEDDDPPYRDWWAIESERDNE